MGREAKRSDAQVQKETKRERRLERQRQEAVARRRIERRRKLQRYAFTAVAVLVLAAGGYLLTRPDPEIAGVRRPPNLGRGHVNDALYASATPTSGEHRAESPRCGRTAQPLAGDLAVHALEHGVVVVWYRPDINDASRIAAEDLLRQWDSHWILSPNPEIEDPFVATAWNRLMTLEAPNETMREFVSTYRRRGPERVDCDA